MRKIFFTLLSIIALTALSGCESAKKAFGGKKTSPDEFLVYKRPPLSQPPNFNLRPPKIGINPQKFKSTTETARDALLGRTNSSEVRQENSATTPGLQALIESTGANAADPNIRKKIDQETSILADEDHRLIDKMIFWVDDKPFEGTIIDPLKEEKRIREAKALGKPITEGVTEHVKRKRSKKGLLEF
jgi:hypothetical protein